MHSSMHECLNIYAALSILRLTIISSHEHPYMKFYKVKPGGNQLPSMSFDVHIDI